MILADNGSPFYISGAADRRWNDADIEQLKRVPASAFEAVRGGPAASAVAGAASVSGAAPLSSDSATLGKTSTDTRPGGDERRGVRPTARRSRARSWSPRR